MRGKRECKKLSRNVKKGKSSKRRGKDNSKRKNVWNLKEFKRKIAKNSCKKMLKKGKKRKSKDNKN